MRQYINNQSVVVVQLGAQQSTQAGRAGVLAGRLLAQALHCFVLVSHVLGLDRQLDVAGLAIDVDHDSGHFVAFLEHIAGIFDAITGATGITIKRSGSSLMTGATTTNNNDGSITVALSEASKVLSGDTITIDVAATSLYDAYGIAMAAVTAGA